MLNKSQSLSALAFGCHFPPNFTQVFRQYLRKIWRKMAPKSFAENDCDLFSMSLMERQGLLRALSATEQK